MKTSEQLSTELEVCAVQYDNKVNEIRERYNELIETNQNLIMDYKSNLQFIVGNKRPLLVSDIMHASNYPIEVLLKNIRILEILLKNPRYYKPSKLVDDI